MLLFIATIYFTLIYQTPFLIRHDNKAQILVRLVFYGYEQFAGTFNCPVEPAAVLTVVSLVSKLSAVVFVVDIKIK